MSSGVVSTGSCMSISAAQPATYDAAGYVALSWTAWGEVTQFGDIGPTIAVQKYNTVCDGVVNKRPGSKDYGTMSIEAAFDSTNAAQILIKAAADALPAGAISAKLELSTGEIIYFKAYPADMKTKIGGADSILMLGVSFEVDGVPVDVAA